MFGLSDQYPLVENVFKDTPLPPKVSLGGNDKANYKILNLREGHLLCDVIVPAEMTYKQHKIGHFTEKNQKCNISKTKSRLVYPNSCYHRVIRKNNYEIDPYMFVVTISMVWTFQNPTDHLI